MNRNQTNVRVLRGDEMNFTQEARQIQTKASFGQTCVVRLGPIVFFSTEAGDAWMLDPKDGYALCLASRGETRPIAIRETNTKLEIEWNADYKIEGEAFVVAERGGSARTILGCPTAEIQRLINEFPAEFSTGDLAANTHRALTTGRNDPCPCGSGKKYKKCCLPRDEALAFEATKARQTQTVKRAESVADSNHPPNEAANQDEPELDPDSDSESQLPDEVMDKADALWEQFEEIENPSPAEMDALLEDLLQLPPEATDWSDLFDCFAHAHYPDLPELFRRIASCIPHTSATGMSHFYWTVTEIFDGGEYRHLLPEVAAQCHRLDLHSYDADALKHIEYYLLANGWDTAMLDLAEYFLPIMRQDKDLMSYVVPEYCGRIFEMRAGRMIRDESAVGQTIESLADRLRQDIEDEIHPDTAHHAAAVVCGQVPVGDWTPAPFNLVTGDIRKDDQAWRDCLRLNQALLRVAQDAWRIEQFPPGCAFPALIMLLTSAYDWQRDQKKNKQRGGNLLEYLRPDGMEARVASSCRGILGVNGPQARLLLQAHEVLLRFALRHQLMPAVDAVLTQKELARLWQSLHGEPKDL